MLSLLLVTTLATTTPAETTSTLPAYNVLVLTLFVLDDPGLLKELNLSGDQLKALQEHRKHWFDEYQKLVYPDRYSKRAAISAANEAALTKILNEKQLASLKKRLYRESCQRFGEFRTLRYPEVVKELTLTQEQQTKLAAGESGAEVLTKEQKQKWDTMRGPRTAELMKVTPPPDLDASLEINPERLMLLVQPAIQQDLKLTEKQKTIIKEQVEKWVNDSPPIQYDHNERLKKLIDALEKAVEERLDDGQRNRLVQLQKQKAIRHGVGFFCQSAFGDESFQKEIGLTTEQKQRVEHLNAQFLTQMIQAASKSESAPEILAVARKLTTAQQDDYLNLLNVEQKKRLDMVYGKPMERRFVEMSPIDLIPIGLKHGTPPLLSLLPYLLIDDALAKELKLNRESKGELGKLINASEDIPDKGKTPAQRLANRQQAQADLVKRIQKVLDKEAFERATQLLLQLIDNPLEGAFEFRPTMLTHWPEMVRELRLNDTQLDLLDEGADLHDVLSAEQRKQYEKLSGEPLPGIIYYQHSPPDFLLAPTSVFLLAQPSIRKELQLSAEQEKKIDEWSDECHETAMRGNHWRDPSLRVKAKQEMDERLNVILKDAQRTRLKQVEWQIRMRDKGLLRMLTDPELMKTLSPTAEETEKIRQLTRQRSQVYRSLERYIKGSEPKEYGEYVKLFFATNNADSLRVETLLGEATTRKLKELIGEPFNGEKISLRAIVNQHFWKNMHFLLFGPPF